MRKPCNTILGSLSAWFTFWSLSKIMCAWFVLLRCSSNWAFRSSTSPDGTLSRSLDLMDEEAHGGSHEPSNKRSRFYIRRDDKNSRWSAFPNLIYCDAHMGVLRPRGQRFPASVHTMGCEFRYKA
ncbi:hypothetical protein FA10DRAFT_16844 [Acaromyces ingoldii]|uniref:Uncharacterized protein n=1 Tax=Acaromyces ingoldii TaxID=215250 RepID=A0A316YVS4_9BASI|nr:hypothetical protein FA10DRAFT_16844 [Acaromyces ingoldii]PWN93232.1 hypothetical protein FA10DRAFT_16844 [Acaromyces ingoldii]